MYHATAHIRPIKFDSLPRMTIKPCCPKAASHFTFLPLYKYCSDRGDLLSTSHLTPDTVPYATKARAFKLPGRRYQSCLLVYNNRPLLTVAAGCFHRPYLSICILKCFYNYCPIGNYVRYTTPTIEVSGIRYTLGTRTYLYGTPASVTCCYCM